MEAQKELKEEGKKPGEVAKLANEKAGLSKEQAEAMKKINLMRTDLMKKAVAMLSEEQKAKLPKQMVRRINQNNRPERGKKKAA